MPKTSKVPIKKAVNSRPGRASPPSYADERYTCSRCGKVFLRQYQNFPTARSSLYRGNGGYLSVCSKCVDELFEHYRAALGNEDEAMRRICMKFDIYWHPKIWGMTRTAVDGTVVRPYIAKTNLRIYDGKTFDDTLDEEAEAAIAEAARIAKESESEPEEPKTIPESLGDVVDPTPEIPEPPPPPPPPPESVEFWGGGLPPEMYPALDARYAKWTDDFFGGLDSASEARYKQICILEETINRSVTQTGKADASTVNALNNLIKDAQKGDGTEADGEFDGLPFGVGIRMFENARPVPKPIPELQDVDGVVKYISVWFII